MQMNQPPLIAAIRGHHLMCVQALLKGGARVDIECSVRCTYKPVAFISYFVLCLLLSDPSVCRRIKQRYVSPSRMLTRTSLCCSLDMARSKAVVIL